MAREPKHSLVELFEATGTGSHCGYCGGERSVSDGMWGYRLTVTDYQNLLLRGWLVFRLRLLILNSDYLDNAVSVLCTRRRSGKYVYKPIMKQTCCPQYAIRCEALKFQLSRSQKKVLKKVYRFLAFGVGEDKVAPNVLANSGHRYDSDSGGSDNESDIQEEDMIIGSFQSREHFMQVDEPKQQPDILAFDVDSSNHHQETTKDPRTHSREEKSSPVKSSSNSECEPNQPHGKKKDIRKERKRQKLIAKGLDPDEEELKRKQLNSPTSLESLLTKPLPDDAKHKLVTRLVMPCERDPYFAETFEETFQLYKKYELTIHKKDTDRPTEKQFTRFLGESPLQYEMAAGQSGKERPVLGSFHMHYMLDGKLIGVDVLDLLPDCVTSVYFFYDPDYNYLSLGTYSVLREIAMVRELNRQFPDVQYASLGFYVHSCPKMQYKAKFQPSYLLCPEVYSWHPFNSCLEKLNRSPYHRLNPTSDCDPDGDMDSNLNKALILYKRNLMTFDVYKLTLLKTRRPSPGEMKQEIERVAHYGKLVGQKCLARMALYCDNAAINREV